MTYLKYLTCVPESNDSSMNFDVTPCEFRIRSLAMLHLTPYNGSRATVRGRKMAQTGQFAVRPLRDKPEQERQSLHAFVGLRFYFQSSAPGFKKNPVDATPPPFDNPQPLFH